jgi:hypothetical protein
MNEIVIVHESTIFDKCCNRFMNELNTIRFQALKISSTTKKENKRLSCRFVENKNERFIATSCSRRFRFKQKNIDKKRLQLYDQLKKIENSLSIQIRIEKIDFVDFLFKRKILEVTSISCRCDWKIKWLSTWLCFANWWMTKIQC